MNPSIGPIAKSAIPPIEPTVYSRECFDAASASRIHPQYMLPAESKLVENHLTHLQTPSYVLLRNAILRLWIKNPRLWVTMEEAQGVAKEERHFALCAAIWEFLVRNGYINFGCLPIPQNPVQREQQTILVVGAGVAGLSTARQLENLLATFADRLEIDYKVIICEGRKRIGGRVYSHPVGDSHDARVDLGAQIITGFSNGNPLTILLQKQLHLPHHALVHAKSNVIYDQQGNVIEQEQDQRVEELFNLLLEEAARFRLEAADGQATDSLGETLNSILNTLKRVCKIPESDLSVLQWHWANMEYACGTNLNNLSLHNWDQDDGNEFNGHHAMLHGGYSLLCRGLALAPTKLDIRMNVPVQKIVQGGVLLSNGEAIKAEKIVVTVPLGVLKADTITFDPPLPDWKQMAIRNLGYGLLNKVVLVYEAQFWDDNINLIGCVRGDPGAEQLSPERGRFYMFWSCTEVSKRPVLTALLAGDAAMSCETTANEELVQEASAVLQRIYPQKQVPQPVESVVTKWAADPFSRGSYSYIGKNGSGKDYEAMARPVGDNLFFAGEATCRTHPSTVHGAYLSGLAAAGAVLDSLIGPQRISVTDEPLVPSKSRPGSADHPEATGSLKRKQISTEDGELYRSHQDHADSLKRERLDKQAEDLNQYLLDKLGPRPELPKRPNTNPFLFFQKEQWVVSKNELDAQQAASAKKLDPTASKNQVRTMIGKAWRDLDKVGREPWNAIVLAKRKEFEEARKAAELAMKEWDERAGPLREAFEKEAAQKITQEEKDAQRAAVEEAGDA
ncbi:flavin-containing amine oxidoreductase-domain containing protein [Protomyces lactucae-debilis]|uniref:Flavin-containing amine oxidoreductase-domain containing protein n=1 Tax=Protomyces lactucae-debilis TaxID=2754530 RepID=A0A1Y2F8U1_PROLT|nr:flavin-containing amine oxidoreductase-domain containing protein [Protomyces lactucae-debilis]ORY80311.1 flavin-containing amine oxidoreductase-domain containing protein [Protomyces lactucae-debilis]